MQRDGIRQARGLRKRMTDAERKLWFALRDRRLDGFKFRRQVPIGRFTVDFFCPEANLVVEVDGGQHGAKRDHSRDAELAGSGHQVVRFWNNDVLKNTDAVLVTILDALKRAAAR